MKRFFRIFIGLVSISLVTLIAGFFWVTQNLKQPNAYDGPQTILIESGNSGMSIAQKLEAQKLITDARIFYGLLRFNHATIKAGEYEIPAHATTRDVLELMQAGKVIHREFTLAEGLSVKQALLLLQQNEYLSGDVTTPPAEGSLLPETYEFTRGDIRNGLIKRMQDAQTKLLAAEWAKRDTAVTLNTPEQAVTLASIVEKETGKAQERPRIAGLFYNRLKSGMLLQSDPTVVYVITDKLGHMGGKPLLGKDLATDSPYNTYKYPGLPPGPIANPGKASLQAVLHPEANDYLFFVADGTGGHVFSTNLKDHQSHVGEWRKIKKELNK